MRKISHFVLMLLILAGCSKRQEKPVATISIVPRPVSLQVGSDNIQWGNEVTIIAKSEEEKNVAGFLQEFLQSKGIMSSVAEASDTDSKITLTTNNASTGAESYSLSINDQGVTIAAPAGAGLFYGAQSLMQIFPVEASGEAILPFVEISDSPRFSYRGLHLDVGRHMFPVEFIKRYIDLMAYHKFNRFHWHLTEDQGWRIEIKKYPKLQEVGAFRKETVLGRASTATRSTAQYDGKPYGGYYTQEEVKEVVQYAAERHVTVVPEIELPGHGLAALAAYPTLGCTGGPYAVATTWGVFNDVYCAGKEETFTFLQDVLDEVIPLFPGEYVHIGGDECPKDSWKACPLCQQRMKKEKLKDEHELQSYFVQRIEKYLNSKGKKIIGWDEILEGGLAPNAAVMSWRGEEGGIAAAQQNHDVIMTPTGWCYFDYYQDTTATDSPLAIGGFLPIQKVYSYEPVPSQLSEAEAKHILGAQANVWTEYMKDGAQVEYMVYPRACAMAEVVWSPREARNYDDFLLRMGTHVKRLDQWKVNYAKHILNDLPKGEITASK